MTLLLFTLNACSIKSQLSQKSMPLAKGWQVTDSIIVSHAEFASDPFGALYILNDNELLKYENHKEIFRFSNFRLGDLTTLDVNNPLATVCFYADFQVIKILDRTLNELTEIELSDWGYSNISAVCQSGNNELWIYDSSSMHLVLLTKDQKTPTRSFPINLSADSHFIITKMTVKDGILYCLSEKGNLYSLPLLGKNLRELIVNEQIVDFKFSANRLLVQNKKGQVLYHKNFLELQPLNLPFLIPPNTPWLVDDQFFIHGNGQVIRFYQNK